MSVDERARRSDLIWLVALMVALSVAAFAIIRFGVRYPSVDSLSRRMSPTAMAARASYGVESGVLPNVASIFSGDAGSGTRPTASQNNALLRAKEYLRSMPLSHDGLIVQLEYEGFTLGDANFAADKCGADWDEQARRKAADYLAIGPRSHEELVAQLVVEGFSSERAERAVTALGV